MEQAKKVSRKSLIIGPTLEQSGPFHMDTLLGKDKDPGRRHRSIVCLLIRNFERRVRAHLIATVETET